MVGMLGAQVVAFAPAFPPTLGSFGRIGNSDAFATHYEWDTRMDAWGRGPGARAPAG